jgi:hypothetical protein
MPVAAQSEIPLEPDIKQRLFAEYGRTLVLIPSNADDPEMLFERVCAEFENVKIEQDEEGSIYTIAPLGAASSDQNAELTTQLRLWAKQDGRGRAFGPDAEFIFPNGSKRGPGLGSEREVTSAPSQRTPQICSDCSGFCGGVKVAH